MRALSFLFTAATLTAMFAAMVVAGAVLTAAIQKNLASFAPLLMSSS